MPLKTVDTEQIRKMNRAGLLKLWDSIDPETSRLSGSDYGKAFEYLVLRAFQIEKARVVWPYEVKLSGQTVEQIDGVVYAAGLACLVESKNWKIPADIEPMAKLRSQLLRRPAGTIGILFARNGFTDPAKLLAQFMAPQTILLWEGPQLQYAIQRQSMVESLQMKYRHAIEHALHDYDIRLPEIKTI